MRQSVMNWLREYRCIIFAFEDNILNFNDKIIKYGGCVNPFFYIMDLIIKLNGKIHKFNFSPFYGKLSQY